MPLAVVPTASNRRATPGKRASKASTLSGSTPSSSATSVAARVGAEPGRGPIAAERAVGLAGLGHAGALGGAGDEAAARALVHERGAAQHGGGHARLAHEPSHHTDDGALAARARDGDARAAGVDDLGQELRAGDAVEAERARRSHLGCVGLDRRRIDEAVDRSRDGGPVVWRELDSPQSEARGDVLGLPLVERAVGALDVVTARPHQDRKSTRLNSSHSQISYAVFCLKKKKE